ncbi:hypothetical protein ACP70R_046340 [Stipagrostis hirtigluma subsp. patula]
MAAPPPPPPLLPDELVEEILLRTPPDEPERLVRTALACKHWCRLISGPGFRRRFRERHRHRAPPLMGIVGNFRGGEGCLVARFAPTCSFRPPHTDRRGWWAIDSRHGRVLLYSPRFKSVESLAVWNPITDDQWVLPPLPLPGSLRALFRWNATVLCAATTGGCDHLDCSCGPYLVVFVCSDGEVMSSSVYSSESGSWSKHTYVHGPPSCSYVAQGMRGALVGSALYFMSPNVTNIIKYDLGTRGMTVICTPPILNRGIARLISEGGRLGSVTLEGSRLPCGRGRLVPMEK